MARSANNSKQAVKKQPMPDMTAPKTIELRVLRYCPSKDSAPAFGSFQVPYTDDMSVLQALQEIKATLDGSLAFRWSCRMAVCGSCGMMINGEPKLACNTFLRDLAPDAVTIEPLQNFPIERDLVVTVGDFVKKIESIYPYVMPKAPKTIEEGTYLQTPAQMEKYASFADCINCMLCYAACPQFGANPDFIGPGAMALLQRYSSDSRDGGGQARLERIRGEDGVWSCTAVGLCSEVCPKQVDPANAVNQNKSKSALDFFLSRLRKESVS
jgi:fumarate reductase iron-sulfur subunit